MISLFMKTYVISAILPFGCYSHDLKKIRSGAIALRLKPYAAYAIPSPTTNPPYRK